LDGCAQASAPAKKGSQRGWQGFRLAFLSRAPNCKLWSSKASRRTARATRRQESGDAGKSGEGGVEEDGEVTSFDKEEPAEADMPRAEYTALLANADQHHTGATLEWLKADADSCKRACDTTVKCRGVSLYTGVTNSLNCRLVGDSMVRGPWVNASLGPWSARFKADFASATGACGGAGVAGQGSSVRVLRTIRVCQREEISLTGQLQGTCGSGRVWARLGSCAEAS